MKTHRIMALLCAGIIALSPVAENVSCVYAAEAQEAELSEETEAENAENADTAAEAEPTDTGDPGPAVSDGDDIGDDADSIDPGNGAGSGSDVTEESSAAETTAAEDSAEAGETAEDPEVSAETAAADEDGETEETEESGTGETVQKDPLGSLLPLEEKQAALILNGYTETELKRVSVNYIVDHLQDPYGNYYNFRSQDHFIWSYYKDDYGEIIRDEYHEVTRSSTVDMSVFDDNSAGYKMELIVGDGNQLGNNTRYIVNVYLTNSISEFNTLELWTQDAQGKRHEVSAERLKHTVSGSEFYVPGHQTGTQYYLAVNSEVFNHPYLNVEVYTEDEYEKRLSDGWQNADTITDIIVNPNMRLKDQGYPTTLDEPDGMTFVLIVENPETHNIYHVRRHKVVVKGSSVHVDSSLWTRENGNLVRAAAMTENPVDWSLYPIMDSSDGVENQGLMMLEGKDDGEEYFITLTAHHDAYGSDAVDHITGTYAGIYDTAAAAAQAGAADLTNKLFADPDSDTFNGYTVSKDNLYTGKAFTVIWDDGTVCKIQINVSRFNNSQSYTRWEDYYSQPVIGEQDPWFRVTGLKLGDRELDTYVVENGKSKTLDTYYGMGYQTLFVNEYISDEELKSLKPVFWVADSDKIRIRTNTNQGAEEVSGVTAHDFTSPNEYYALFEGRQKNYIVEVVPKAHGPKLYVFGSDGTEYERNREIFLDDYYQYRHDILIANVGDQELEGLSVRLENASHVKIDDYWTVGGTGNNALEPFTTADRTQEYGELQNLAKVRIVSDGAGEITGDLIISAEGQESVVIHLSGSAIQPVIRTTDLTYAVKYVPYSYIISTSNMNEKVDVTYELKGKLPSGMRFDSKTGELYGVPMETGTYSFTVTANYSEQSFEPSTQKLKLEVKDNEDEIVFNATDEGYEIIPEENGVSGYVGEQVSDYRFELDENANSETFITGGEFSEFERLWINGVELVAGTDYVAEPGSTISHLFLDIIRKKPVLRNGRNTISVEYNVGGSDNSAGSSGTNSSSGSSSGRSYDSWRSNGGGGGGSTVRRAAQNFWIGTGSSSEPSVTRYFKISKTSANLHKGKTLTLKISRNYTTSIAWATTNPKVATVNKYGKVTAVGKGNCTIVAKSGDGKTQKCKIHVMIPVKTIKLNKTSMRLGAGKYETLTTTVTPSNVDKKDFVWTSSNKKIAAVNASGRVKGISKGTCTITVKTPNGIKRTCKVTVYNIIAVKSVKLNATEKTLNKGASFTLKATIAPSNASNKTLTWYSSNTKVAKVTSAGKVTAVGPGVARIKAKSNNGKIGSCLVTVKLVPVSSIALKLDKLILNKGAATKLAVDILPASASDKTTVWSSSDESIATVDNGEVTGIEEGTAVITVTSSNGLTSSCNVTVVDPDAAIPEVNLNNRMLEILEGGTETLSAELVTAGEMDETLHWESTRPDVAEVDEAGLVTAKKAGYTTIIARTVYNTVATCSVHVKAPVIEVTQITLDRSSIELNPGYNEQKTAVLTAQILPADATDKSVSWTSADENIAVVKDGTVSARSAGVTTITATSSNGLSAHCQVTVVEGPRRISTVQDLIGINNDLQADYILANDIDLNGINWTPIGGDSGSFQGTFDGNGYTITGLNVTSGEYCGLFSQCRGSIKNLTVFGQIHVNGSYRFAEAGGICGSVGNSAQIINCESNVDIVYNNQFAESCTVYCGGIAGCVNSAIVYNCTNHGNIQAKAQNSDVLIAGAGGIAGWSINQPYIGNCTNDGNVLGFAAPDDSLPYVRAASGGIIGEIENGSTIENCHSSGTVGAYSDVNRQARGKSYVAAGGVVGTKNSVSISGCSGSTDLGVSCNAATMRQFTGAVIGCVEPTSVQFNLSNKTMAVGNSFTLNATVYPSDASSKELIWSSTDDSVATVTNGVVQALKPGKATIKAESVISGSSAECTVTVTSLDPNEITEVTVTSSGSYKVGIGQQIQCTATVKPESAPDKSVVWSSSDPSVATVDQNGLVTTHKAGDVDIIATAVNGVSGSTWIRVSKAYVQITGDNNYTVNRGEIMSIPVRLYLEGNVAAGNYQYILYTAYYSGNYTQGWIELASFNIDGATLFQPRYVGLATVTSYTVNGNIVDLTLDIDTSKMEKMSGKILSIDVFPYNNFSSGASLGSATALITIK